MSLAKASKKSPEEKLRVVLRVLRGELSAAVAPMAECRSVIDDTLCDVARTCYSPGYEHDNRPSRRRG